MRKRGTALIGGLALLLLTAGVGVSAVTRVRERVGANGVYRVQKTFRAGERACVIAVGDHRPVVPVDVLVYDEKNNLVARDTSDSDMAAATWYPPRTARYRVEVHNHAGEYNDMSIFMQGLERD